MPENTSLYRQLVEKYGQKRGETIYWGMVGRAEGPFAPGKKYHGEHRKWARRAGVEPIE